ncbi:MAG TPA: prepilin peptidase [Candidatus Sabulitectum sp.]|nr:prepilin peptidase [Candidatus Sabulitectum sp.]HPF31849.1 prepilin peptidase [Candidatus Sabulitectum sp.]
MELYSSGRKKRKYPHAERNHKITADSIFTIFAGLLGLCIGSFLNVVSWRVPLGKSIVSPPSACPGCGKEIEPRDNIPVLSYILLLGKCRSCRMPISFKYPATELATGVLFLLAALETGLSLQFVTWGIFISLMVVAFRTDIDEFLILDEVSLGGAAAGMALSLLPGGMGIVKSASAAAGGFLFFLLIRVGASLYLKKSGIRTKAPEGFEEEEDEFQGGMGWGDVKLAACIGAFLGPASTAMAFFAAFILGAVTGGALMILRKRGGKVPIPFGPFMAAGAVLALFLGEELWNAYIRFVTYQG